MRRATEAREQEMSRRQKSLGFLHFDVRRADPMSIWHMNAFIARVYLGDRDVDRDGGQWRGRKTDRLEWRQLDR